MTVSAYEHHELMEFLKDRWGPEKAGTTMNLLPVVGWSAVATKDDIASMRGEIAATLGGLENRIEMTGAQLRAEMGSMEARLSAQNSNNMRLLFLGTLASNATLVGLVLAATRVA